MISTVVFVSDGYYRVYIPKHESWVTRLWINTHSAGQSGLKSLKIAILENLHYLGSDHLQLTLLNWDTISAKTVLLSQLNKVNCRIANDPALKAARSS